MLHLDLFLSKCLYLESLVISLPFIVSKYAYKMVLNSELIAIYYNKLKYISEII